MPLAIGPAIARLIVTGIATTLSAKTEAAALVALAQGEQREVVQQATGNGNIFSPNIWDVADQPMRI
jgi:hypothetical protein